MNSANTFSQVLEVRSSVFAILLSISARDGRLK